MAKFDGFKCDECTIEKKVSNHWLLGFTRDRQINLIPWEDKLAVEPDAIHLCGAGCVAKVVSREIHAWQDAPAAVVLKGDGSWSIDVRKHDVSPDDYRNELEKWRSVTSSPGQEEEIESSEGRL